ncbi:MAG: hypothetical protein J6M30_07775 [Bacteroidales bacterium]|nr:hypothetical protein [Bacteroidales bacterium]
MKTVNLSFVKGALMTVFTAFIVSSCAVEGTVAGYDDIYADDSEIAFEEENYQRNTQRSFYQDKRYTHNSKQYRERYNNEYALADTAVVEDSAYFDMDDYYDYAYTARLHRFHDPAPIYGYYDDFYTNLYWYDRDPLLWGTSIYLGYRWWWPSIGLSWGWNPWYRHSWYGWHYGWYDYAWGWYGGYHHGYWGHRRGWHDAWYFNSKDRNSNFYRSEHDGGRLVRANGSSASLRPGYRGEPSATGSTKISRNASSNSSAPVTFGDKYNQRFGNTAVNGRSTVNNKLQRPVTTNRNNVTPSQRMQKPASRTVQPASTQKRPANVNSQPQRRSYTPASQRQQRSSNVYRNNNQQRSRNITTPSSSRSSSLRSSSSPSRSSSSSMRSSSSSSRSSSSGMRSSGGSHSSSGVSRGGSRR